MTFAEEATSVLEHLFHGTELPQKLAGTEPSDSPVREFQKFAYFKLEEEKNPEVRNSGWLQAALLSSALDHRLFALSQQICLLRDPKKSYEDTLQGIGILAAYVMQLMTGNLYQRGDDKAMRRYKRLLKAVAAELGGVHVFYPDLIPNLLIIACAALDPLEPLLREAYHRRQVVVPRSLVQGLPLSLLLGEALIDLDIPPTRLAILVKSDDAPESERSDGVYRVWVGGRQVRYKFQGTVIEGGGKFVIMNGKERSIPDDNIFNEVDPKEDTNLYTFLEYLDQ